MKYDVVILGGGRAGLSAAAKLSAAGRKVLVIGGGRSLYTVGSQRSDSFTLLRGVFALRGEFSGNRLLRVFADKLTGTPLEADFFILATGKFFSRGLISTMNVIFEPVFGCDVCYERDRSRWTDPDFFAPQPFERFGLVCDEAGRVSIDGQTVSNLFAAGEILAGEVDVEQSVERVCRNII